MMAKGTTVILGVGPGLGLALTRAFADEGHTVIAAARSASRLEPLLSLAESADVIPFDCDGTYPGEIESLLARADETGTPLRAAIFNAGTFEPGRVADIEPEDFERCWRVGCFSGFLLGRAAAKRMLAQGAGTILLTGATAALRGSAGFANLASPKFALRALGQSMARELGPENIHVAHVVIDGQIASERYAHLEDKRGPDSLLSPEAIAKAFLFLHRQPRDAWTQELDLRPWVEKF